MAARRRRRRRHALHRGERLAGTVAGFRRAVDDRRRRRHPREIRGGAPRTTARTPHQRATSIPGDSPSRRLVAAEARPSARRYLFGPGATFSNDPAVVPDVDAVVPPLVPAAAADSTPPAVPAMPPAPLCPAPGVGSAHRRRGSCRWRRTPAVVPGLRSTGRWRQSPPAPGSAARASTRGVPSSAARRRPGRRRTDPTSVLCPWGRSMSPCCWRRNSWADSAPPPTMVSRA